MSANTNAEEVRCALVTGGGRGIGRGIVEALAAAGCTVAIADLPGSEGPAVVEALTAAGSHAIFVEMDVADSASVQRAVGDATKSLGSIDIVVNNAGWDKIMPFIDTDEELWHQVVNINYLGNLRVTHAVLPAMIERGWGRVINIGSDAARVGSSFEAVYSGAKGAIVSFTKTLAREVAKKGVTVNVVCPGPTQTPGMAEAMQGENSAKILESMARGIPIGRLGEPSDIGAAVAFFASEGAAFITGQTLSVSGGLTMA